MCVPAVLGALAMWIQNQDKKRENIIKIVIIIITILNSISKIHYQDSITSIQNNILVSKVQCGRVVRFSQALSGFLIAAPHLCAFLLYLESQLCGA